MRILLAEDEKELSRALCAVLQHQGYETDAAYDGEEALELAFSRSYDCMVFDIMMPKLDGVTAVRRIRDSGIVTPVIMLTAKSEVDDRVEGLDAGADDYLTKPFAMKELMARLRSMTRRSKAFTPTRLSLGSVTLNTEEQELTGSNSIRLAKKESKRVFGVFKNQIKGKKVLELAEYFLSRKTQGAIVHHILNLDGILFKNVDIDAFVPEVFANKKTKQVTDKIKYVADIGVKYNKMKKKERGKTKRGIVAYINKPIDQLKKQVNTFMIRAEMKVLSTYKLISNTIKNKLKELDFLKKENSLDFQLE